MFQSRLDTLRQLLIDHSLDAALITSVPTITFLTGYAGFSIEEREAFLFITANQPLGSKTPGVSYVLTDGRYITAIKNEVTHFKTVEIGSRYQFKKAFETLVTRHGTQKLGIEENNLLVHEYKTILPFVKETMHIRVNQLRIKKTAEEISLIAKACQIGDQALAEVLPRIKPGITEKQLALWLENAIRELGAEPSFKTIVAFNHNAAIPHHQTGQQKLGTTGLVLIDSGVKLHHYCSDMTRTVFLGKANPEQKKMYEVVLEAQKRAAEYLDTTLQSTEEIIIAADVDKVAREYITSQGYPSIPHSLGHGIGLEVHEVPMLSPVSQNKLDNGMVFSIEPGIYLPGIAGVRIEDLFVIENNKLRQLTHSPKTLLEL